MVREVFDCLSADRVSEPVPIIMDFREYLPSSLIKVFDFQPKAFKNE
jgi:hypothetical protein